MEIKNQPPALGVETQSQKHDAAEVAEKRLIIQTGFLDALNLRPNQVDLTFKDGTFEFMVRLRKTNKFSVLPSGATMKREITKSVASGSSEELVGHYKGASHVVVGTIGFGESTLHGEKRNHISVTMRLVESKTGQVLQAGDSSITCGSVILGRTMGAAISEARQRMRGKQAPF